MDELGGKVYGRGYQDTLVFLNLHHRGNLTPVSKVCEAVTISLFLVLKRFNEAF